MERETRNTTPPPVGGATKKDISKDALTDCQRATFEISVSGKQVTMRVNHDPLIAGIDRHKINYGVPPNQAAVLKLAHTIVHQLERDGFVIESQK